MNKIGKVAEIRVTRAALDVLTVSQHAQLEREVRGFNNRGPGNFKLAIGQSNDEVTQLLRQELRNHFATRPELIPLVEFRVNFNEVVGGLTWEGFTIGGFTWESL